MAEDPMKPTNLTIAVLKEIRDEVRKTNVRMDEGFSAMGVRIDATNERLDATNERLDATNERLDATNGRLEALGSRLVDSEIRVATALTDLNGTLRDNTAFLRNLLDIKPRVERCEREIAELREKLPDETR